MFSVLSRQFTPSPPLPHTTKPTYDSIYEDDIIIIDENIHKKNNNYIFNNGSLLWINNTPCYIIKTGILYNNLYEIHILYIIRGPDALKKRYVYFDSFGTFQECEIS